MTDNELIKWCIKNLGSPSGRQTISCNWTRCNFEYLKKRWPDIWKHLQGKTLTIKGKSYKFINKNYKPIIINNNIYRLGGSNSDNGFLEFIRNITESNPQIKCKELMLKIIENNKTEGPCLLHLIKKCYSDDYKYIMDNFSKGSNSKREIVYRYIHNLKDIPKLNNKKLKFRTYEMGYHYFYVYKNLKNIKTPTKREIIYAVIKTENIYNHTVKILKLYYPEIISFLKDKFQNTTKNLDEQIYLYVNNLETPPKCLFCEKNNATWRNSYIEGYRPFCSKSCCIKFNSIQHFGKLENSQLDKWEDYQKICRRYTDCIYRKYRNIIDPKSQRGSKFEVDHIIPISYGFLNNIDIKIICHPKNLKLISRLENRKKGMKILLNEYEIKDLLEVIKKDLEF